MAHTYPVVFLGLTALLGLLLSGYVLREVRSPVLLRRAHLLAGASALGLFLLAVDQAANAIPRPPGSSGHLAAGLLIAAIVLGLLIGWVARYARAGLTLARALHVCIGFCGLILAMAWVLRPGG